MYGQNQDYKSMNKLKVRGATLKTGKMIGNNLALSSKLDVPIVFK